MTGMMENQAFRRSDGVIFTEVGDDLIALHIANGQCYGMENIAVEVWNLLKDAMSLDQICDLLMQKYDVARPTCRKEVGQYLNELRSQGLVEAIAEPGGAAA